MTATRDPRWEALSAEERDFINLPGHHGLICGVSQEQYRINAYCAVMRSRIMRGMANGDTKAEIDKKVLEVIDFAVWVAGGTEGNSESRQTQIYLNAWQCGFRFGTEMWGRRD